MAGLSQERQFSLLKKGLPEAIVMAKVWGFSVRTVQEELSFALSDSDYQQFSVSAVLSEAPHVMVLFRLKATEPVE